MTAKPWAWARSDTGTVFHMVRDFTTSNVAGRLIVTATVGCRHDLVIHAPETVHPFDFEPGDLACQRCLEVLRRHADWIVELHEAARQTREGSP